MLGSLGGMEGEVDIEAKMSSRSSMPAFRATKSRRWKCAWAWEKAWDWEGQDETSVFMKRVRVEGRLAVGGGGLMSKRMTDQFLDRRCWVSARPMPEEAPVIRATGAAIAGSEA